MDEVASTVNDEGHETNASSASPEVSASLESREEVAGGVVLADDITLIQSTTDLQRRINEAEASGEDVLGDGEEANDAFSWNGGRRTGMLLGTGGMKAKSAEPKSKSDISLIKSTINLQLRIDEAEARLASSSTLEDLALRTNSGSSDDLDTCDRCCQCFKPCPPTPNNTETKPKVETCATSSEPDKRPPPKNAAEGPKFRDSVIHTFALAVDSNWSSLGEVLTIPRAAQGSQQTSGEGQEAGPEEGLERSESWFAGVSLEILSESIFGDSSENKEGEPATESATATTREVVDKAPAEVTPTMALHYADSSSKAKKSLPAEVWENQRFYGPFIGWHGLGERPSKTCTQEAHPRLASTCIALNQPAYVMVRHRVR
eukprot:1196046-Prorocentrum_minimum.AAC.4